MTHSFENQFLELLKLNQRLHGSIHDIIATFQRQEEQEGYNKLILLGLELQQFTILSEPFQFLFQQNIIDITQLNTMLKQLVEAIMKRDTVFVTDILEYEALPFLEEMFKKLTEEE